MHKCGKYDIEIIQQNADDMIFFSIRAICRDSGRYSSINNLNAILSLLDVDVEDQQFEDSTWIVSEKQVDAFSKVVHCALSDESFVDYLEKGIDDDRLEGEWENSLHSILN